MPTSNSEQQATKSSHRARTFLIILLTFVVLDVALCLALEPYGAHTELVWWDYRRSAKDIDTIVVGTSNAAYGIEPQTLDATLGSTSFNMATPEQPLDLNLSTIKSVNEERGLKRVILGVGYETMLRRPYFATSVLMVQAKCVGEPLPEAISDLSHLYLGDTFFGRQESLFGLFPFAYSHVDLTPRAIAENIHNRLNYGPLEGGMRYLQGTDPNWSYGGQGFFAYAGGLGPGIEHGSEFTTFKDEPFLDSNFADLRALCRYCKDQGIALYVFTMRYTPSAVLYYKDSYHTNMSKVKEAVEAEGATFLDLNMAHRDVFDMELLDHKDFTHLNAQGAKKASAFVGSLIGDVESGKDVSGKFYDYTPEGWDAYLKSIDYVDTVEFSYSIDSQGNAHITAEPRTSDTVAVEARLDVHDPEGNGWNTVCDYQSSPEFVLPSNGQSTRKVRVYARPAGKTDATLERWAEGAIDY